MGLFFTATPAFAAPPAPAFKITSTSLPTNFAPDSEGEIFIVAENVGALPTTATTITDLVPDALEVASISVGTSEGDRGPGLAPICGAPAQTVLCTDPGPLRPGYQIEIRILVKASSLAQLATNQVSIEGGGAAQASTSSPVVVSSALPDFGFLSGDLGLDAPFTESDGAVATQAGAHPYQLTIDVGFPTKPSGKFLVSAGHLHDATVDLPRGVIVNPSATPVLCTEAQLVAQFCPPDSQIGLATSLTKPAVTEAVPAALYNMVPPPGHASSFAFDVAGVGVFVHVLGSVRSDGDFGLSGAVTEIPAFPTHPVFGSRFDLWGDPSAQAHDGIRGQCAPPAQAIADCPAGAPADTALLTLPDNCPGGPSLTTATAHSWESPAEAAHAGYESADLAGGSVSVSGCSQLEFEPTIDAQPTTDLADSPSGLDFNLHQPQSASLQSRSPAALRDARVTLPEGFTVNPSQAQGLAACSAAQVGLTSAVGESPARFTKQPQQCPDAAKIGTLQVRTPLLGELDESGAKFAHDPQTGALIPRPLEGSVFLAAPFDNPFDSLLAIYLVVEDPRSGTVAKLAGQVIPDPQTGRLTSLFTENPQLPLEDVDLHLFGGARGSLITPPNCATHTITSDLTPWSTPEGLDAHPQSSFATTNTPTGGPCPASPDQAPNNPTFSAGTLSPQAGAYSPFVLKLSREDGTARLTGFDTTLPPGLTGRLAGIPTCSEAALALAASRSNPKEGILERTSPSCPPASALGTVDVAAGAGPTPFHTQGTAYLAGPYKGAPLSMAVITPAIAGPFDLGTVVVRAALNVDPETARIHAVSDPFPTILHGIPLDLRSVAVKLDRPDFTLNPTSCDEMQITGIATSSFGSLANLTSPFQVGGCQALPFKPKLALILNGGTKRAQYQRLRAVVTMKPGEANIASASVALPHSEFLAQNHIRTVCTRVQFAADACPAGSVYGKATALSPLLDYPLTGSVYLRSSNNPLPDLVVALKGPPSQPIEIDLAGRTDSVHGGIRNTFDLVPDAPVSKFTLELFGGQRSLIENSRNICAQPQRATVKLDGQNGKIHDTTPTVQNSCKGKKKGGHHKRSHRRHRAAG